MLPIAWARLSAVNTLMLSVIILQVIWLSSQMEATGVMRDLVESLLARFSRRTSVAMLPAVIGLLPMPGGALFSAPLVGRCDLDGSIPGTLKTHVNYWFRHVWEYWWPLYPGMLLAMDISGVEAWQFMLLGLPVSLAAVAVGSIFFLRKLEAPGRETPTPNPTGRQLPFISLVSPILVVIVCYGLIRIGYARLAAVWGTVPEMNDYAPIAVGLLLAALFLQRQRPLAWTAWKRILTSTRAPMMVAIVLVMQVYGAFINAPLSDGTRLTSSMAGELAQLGIPLAAVFVVFPFISGLTTGIAVGFVGASFPIVFSLLGNGPSAGTVLSTTVLAFGSGFLGVMLSPIHVCLIVTNQHFNTRLHRSLVGLVAPTATLMAIIFLWHIVVKRVWA
jgi:integral membrane protein (TIGR00529 family)